jgi:hypothetical protein
MSNVATFVFFNSTFFERSGNAPQRFVLRRNVLLRSALEAQSETGSELQVISDDAARACTVDGEQRAAQVRRI